MHLRNGEHGYGVVTKLLHWVTVAAIVAQFVVGWTMAGDEAADDAADRATDRATQVEERQQAASKAAEERFEQRLERLEEQAEAQGEAAEERFDEEADRLEEQLEAEQAAAERRQEAALEAREEEIDQQEDDDVSTLHVVLGISIAGLALLRLLWRRTTPLPPWAEHLGPGERKLEGWLEKALLTLLLVVPATGLLLVYGDDDLLVVHVTAQIALLATIAVHVGLVLSHTVLRRNKHLSRML